MSSAPVSAVTPARHTAVRLGWLAGLGVWMALCYFPAQRWAAGPAWVVPLLPFEPLIPYHPLWVLVYQSIWPVHAAMIVVLSCPKSVRGYARDTAATYGLAAPWFWLLPSTVDRPEDGDALYRSLVLALDGPTNALPSLHAVMVTLVVLHLRPLVLGWTLGVVAGWWVLVICATLATGQHRMLDLVAGTALALGVNRVTWLRS